MSQRRFGRLVEHDPRSRWYAIEDRRGFDAARNPAVYPDVEWRRWSPILNQGDLGSCTGNAMVGWLGCEPHCSGTDQAAKYDEAYARDMYSQATRLDDIPGHWPDDDTGSSGNAVAKAARMLGEITSYSWAFTTAGLLHALQHGPVIAGIPWYERMSVPDDDGSVHIGGEIEGGHELLIRGWRGGRLLCDNSLGEGWGQAGRFTMSLTVWEHLRRLRADVTIPHAVQGVRDE
jgi:hypothetical protein